MNELVSIVVPIYNMGDSIETCVASLQKQDYPNIEILLIDDGSKDDSFDRCKELKNKDPRIQVFHTENRGSGPARNHGIEHARGRYIYFPDADDFLEPDAITTMVEAMDNGHFDLAVFGFRWVNQNGETIKEKKYEDMERDGQFIRNDYADYMTYTAKYGIQGAPWNKFFDLKVIRENKVEYPALRRHQDEGFIARYMCHVKRVHFINRVLYTYYVNDLQKEWKKYPVDYIDAVIGLNETRKETILTWNPADTATHDLIIQGYICGVIKAMELTFSPKHGLKSAGRITKMKEYAEKSGIERIAPPPQLGVYQRVVLWMLRRKRYSILYMIVFMKICVEKFLH